MSDLREFSIGKKRKADFALRDHEDQEAPKKQPESYIASVEELKNRRIVKVIRPAATVENPNDNAPKGKFTFLNPIDGNQSQDIKQTDSQKKIYATTSTIRLNKSLQETENQITESVNATTNTYSERKIEKVDERLSGVSVEQNKVESSSKKQEVTTEKFKINLEETKQPLYYTGNVEKKFHFGAKSSTGSENNFTNTENTLQKPFPFTNVSNMSGFNTNLINTNPFARGGDTLNKTDNAFNPFSRDTNNRFGSDANNLPPASTGANKINFTFNLANASKNPNWDSEDDDEGDYQNPEEEISISGRTQSSSKPIDTNPNLVKFLKISVNDLSEYNFETKKYQSKGKGDLSLELTRTEKNTVVAMCAFRNNALKILFQGSIIAKVTFLTLNNKNYKHIIVIQKLFSVNESTNKPEAKSVRLEFNSEIDFNLFREKFETALKILETNDLTVFPEIEKSLASEEKNKHEEKLGSGSKSKQL